METDARSIRRAVQERGFAHVAGPLDGAAYRRLASELGEVIGEERIALRPGAHAYVAKPGPVPFHTDHPEVQIIGWLCVAQDPVDGASRLLDALPLVKELSAKTRQLLRAVDLWCPPLAGGPPTMRWPVLRPADGREAVFCSPWLRSASGRPEHEQALEEFRYRLSSAAVQSAEVRLSPGQALFVDNRRILHGRRAIAESSRRELHRLWIVDA